jgi:hypothetical protein
MDASDYNAAGARALERAQKASGVRSAEAFAKLLAARTGGQPSTSTYHRWLRGDAPIPFWVVLAAAEQVDQSLDTLAASADLPPSILNRLAQIEAVVADLSSQLAEVRVRLGLPTADISSASSRHRPS